MSILPIPTPLHTSHPLGAISSFSLTLYNSTKSRKPTQTLVFCRDGARAMKLLTHNMLSSNIKGVTNGFPLRIETEKVIEKAVQFNPDFLKNMLAKIDWKALVEASRIIGYADLPNETDSSMLESDELLQKFHHALLEIHVEDGALVCPETDRKFPVSKGIPNMLLHEDEI